uniref:RabBD domain-containing protein n=1 Tax=Neogobius melanostomus TaxID=47308 RepID=A0A8C6UPN1_9GOBI
MGRKLDLSGLTDDEAEHVLRVVQRDMKLRRKEEDRLSEMKQELAEEGSRCSILSRQHRFNEHCCIRCCAPFTFLLNPKRLCLDCQYNVCKSCCTYTKRDKAWLCSACQKGRILRTQSLEWYYNNVKSRFKRFGSAKVLKTLYRKHIIERGALSDLPESSVHEGSNENDGSICGSEAAFYKQSEGHSMAETLTVALRVAEEAIEEAIAKAEEFGDSLEKQNEARYLRDHKEELIEELATTIVQKVGRPRYQRLLRSRSAFSLTSDDSPEKGPEEEGAGVGAGLQDYSSFKREGKTTSLPSWKSVDRLDNSSASSVLQSPDGNWIALQSSQLSRPSLLTKRKSLVFSVLEKESGVVSAYDGMGSDSEVDDEGGWGAALHQFRRKLSDETYYTDSQHDPEWTYTHHHPITSPSSGQYTNTETLNSDSEASSVLSAYPRKPPHNLMKKRGPADTHLHPHHPSVYHQQLQHNPYSLPSDALDVNFNPKVSSKQGLVSEEHPAPEYSPVSTTAPDVFRSDAMTPEPEDPDTVAPNSAIPSPPPTFITSAVPLSPKTVDPIEEELRSRLSQMVRRANSKEEESAKWASERLTEKERQRQSDTEKQREKVGTQDMAGDIWDLKYSAASLCSITTEVLKVLNATEELIGEAGGESYTPTESVSPISSCSETRRLDQRLTKMEENVYLAAGAVYSLEGALGDLEHCARDISSGTSDTELAFLEDQVATAAAQVQQSELQISNIEARISALKTAGLNVTVCNRFSKFKPRPKPQTLDSSRHQRRKLPAPPLKGTEYCISLCLI